MCLLSHNTTANYIGFKTSAAGSQACELSGGAARFVSSNQIRQLQSIRLLTLRIIRRRGDYNRIDAFEGGFSRLRARSTRKLQALVLSPCSVGRM